MLRRLIQLASLCLLLAGGWVGYSVYRSHNALDEKLQKEHEKNQQLQLFVQRLSGERRVADLIVTDQSTSAGITHTNLVFVEYDRKGDPLPARRFAIDGAMVHIDAMVVKFDGKFVQQNDALRGHSIALFTSIYGEHQSPQSAQPIDEPGTEPLVYRNTAAQTSAFERQLWQNFWKLADDPAYRQGQGVRIAQGEGIWRPVAPGNLYTLTLENNGGLNITAEKIRGIYQEFLGKTPVTHATE